MNHKSNKLLSLGAAALVLNGVAPLASANPPDGKTTVDLRVTSYTEDVIPAGYLMMGSPDRYSIDVVNLKFKTPTSDDSEISGYVISESMSGASPMYVMPYGDEYVQVMSGATIDESRTEVGADFRKYHGDTESTFSASISSENDYESFAVGYSGAWRFNANQTTFSYGLNGSRDTIDASHPETDPARPVDESKLRFGGFVGITQAASKTTLLSATFGLSAMDGYLSDAYKKALVLASDDEGNLLGLVHDARPDHQNAMNLGLSLREFFPLVNAAAHLDYSFYNNDWDVNAHTITAAWYQNLGHGLQLIPSVRFYSQTAAEFYAPTFYEARQDNFYSSDYRLSEFTAVSGGIKLAGTWGKYRANLSYERYEADGDHPGLVKFDHIGLGLGMSF